MSDAVLVALIAAVPAIIAAYGGLKAAHRSSGSDRKFGRLVKDVEFIKNIMILHVTDARLHPELTDLGTQTGRNRRNG